MDVIERYCLKNITDTLETRDFMLHGSKYGSTEICRFSYTKPATPSTTFIGKILDHIAGVQAPSYEISVNADNSVHIWDVKMDCQGETLICEISKDEIKDDLFAECVKAFYTKFIAR